MDGWMEASPRCQYKTVQTDLSERTMRPARTAPLKLQAGECKGEGYVYVFYQLSDVGKDNFHLPLRLLLGSPHTRSPVHYKAKWQACRVDDLPGVHGFHKVQSQQRKVLGQGFESKTFSLRIWLLSQRSCGADSNIYIFASSFQKDGYSAWNSELFVMSHKAPKAFTG